MALEVAQAVLAYRHIAGKPFTRQWAAAIEDGSEWGAADDLSDVTAARATAELRVARGETAPAATAWTLDAGLSIGTVTQPNSVVYPALTLDEATGLDAGVYDLKIVFTRAGVADWFLAATLELTEQP